MKMKNIWIVNEYAGSPKHGMEFRHYYLAKEFVKEGHDVTIVSSSYSHLFKKLPHHDTEQIDGITYKWIKTFNYGESHGKKRVLKWILFMLKCFLLPFSLKKPNVIIVSPMAQFSFLPLWIIAKIFRAKIIYEVKDIWPLTLIEIGGYSRLHPFIKLISWFEKFAIKNADVVVSNLQSYDMHIKNLGINKDFVWISNGIDLDEMKQIQSLEPKIESQIPKDKFIVGYTGTIGVANALDSFLDSAIFVDENIVFLLVGDGQEKERLQNKYGTKNNIIFLDSINKGQVQSMLHHFDVCFLGWNDEPLYKYGTSANKIFDYMYSGKPILNAFNGNGDLVKLYNCGLTVTAQDSKSISEGIMKLYHMSQEQRLLMGENGKEAVEKYFSYHKLAKKYTEYF